MSAADWLISPRVVDRARVLLERDPSLRSTISTPDDVAAISTARSSIEYVIAACTRYGDRACFVSGARTLTYGALLDRVRAIAGAAVVDQIAAPHQLIGICGLPSADWVTAELVCLYIGAVSVPLHVGMSHEQLRHAIRTAELATIYCAAPQLPLIQALLPECPSVRTLVVFDTFDALAARAFAVPPCPLSEDALVTINFSSGSTGMPKGVMLSERRWAAQLRFALTWPRIPHVHFGYLPLSHISGRRLVLEVMMNGGVTHFPASGDVSAVFDEIRRVRPTVLPLLPHLANLTYQHFQTRCASLPAASVIEEMRTAFLGDRLCLIRTGTAPLAQEVLEFVERCFDMPVANGYGSTELGSIAINGRVLPHNEYKLVDAPELGYRVTDTPPRGELVVRSPEAATGYLHEPEATRALFDAEGYLRTGDVVEESTPGTIVTLGRRNDVLRLAHGEFINVSELEGLFGGGIPLIRQIFIYGNPQRSVLLAVVVAGEDDPALRRQLRVELDRVARDKRLPPHEVPRDFIITTEPFSRDNGLLTDALKIDRPRLTARYREPLEALYTQMDARSVNLSATGTVPERVRAAISATLGVDGHEVAWADVSFTGLGGDSLSAVRLCQLVNDAVGVAPQVAIVLDPTTTLAMLVVHIAELLEHGQSSTYDTVHGDADTVRAADLDIDQLLGRVAPGVAFAGRPRVILLTGATGFLGRHLLLELLARLPVDGRVICLVRAADDRAAERRLGVTDPRVTVYASDLMRPRLGLAAQTYAELARDAEAIVHNGALVNHALPYASLFGPNVEGTLEVIRLAIARRIPIHFVASIGIVDRAGGVVHEHQRADELWPTRSVGTGPNEHAVGYITSKWAGEILLAQLHERHGVPVTIFRCGVLLPHREIANAVNARDAFHRLLDGIVTTRLAPRSFYAGTGAPYFGGVPVDLAASTIAAIATEPTTGIATYHVDEPDRSDVTMDTFLDAIAEAGVAVERLAYADWYREFHAALAALPEPARSRSPLQIVGRWVNPSDPQLRRQFSATRFAARAGKVAPLDRPYIAAWIRSLVAGTGA